jgi:hypothetical protein
MNSTLLADTTLTGQSLPRPHYYLTSHLTFSHHTPNQLFRLQPFFASWKTPAGIDPIQATAHPMSYQWSESGGWDRFGSSDNGSPPGFYQWQPLSFAFNVMLTLERRAMRRYSFVVRMRVDGKFQSKMPSIQQWSKLFFTDSAYAYKS